MEETPDYKTKFKEETIMFREIREVKAAEKNLGLQVKEQKFLNIKPEKELSKKELDDSVALIFNKIANDQTNNKG